MTEVSFAKSFLTTLDNKPTKYQPDHVFDPATFGVRIPYVLPKLPTPQHPPPPKPQHDLSQAPAAPPPGAEPASTTTNTINLTLKSSRNPNMTLSLPSTPPTTTITSLKQQIQSHLGGSSVVASVDKIKILHNKKPIPSSKATIGEVIGSDGTTKNLELGVMVMGGAPDPPAQSADSATATGIKLRSPEAAGPGSENAAVEADTGVNPGDTVMEDVVATSQKPRAESQSHPVQPGEESGDAVLAQTEFWTDLEGFLAQRLRSQDEAVKLRGVFERAWRSTNSAP